MRCKMCHRRLLDPVSIERKCGPICYAKLTKDFVYQIELNFEPKLGSDKSALQKNEIVNKILNL